MVSRGKLPKSKRRLPKLSGSAVGYNVNPASISMYKTSLYHKEFAPEPQMNALSLVRQALERDKIEQVQKYGAEEPDPRYARFNVRLPRSPQHDKYSWQRSPRQLADDGLESEDGMKSTSSAAAELPGGIRFNMKTLRNWFRDIDRDDSGVISQRELIVALRKQKGLLDMFCVAQGMEKMPQKPAPDDDDVGHERAEIYRIRDILKEVDTDGSGSMEWDEFVDFFRRAGLLLEYKTKKDRNRTTLCSLLDSQREEELNKEMARKETARRAATRTAENILGDLCRSDMDPELPLTERTETTATPRSNDVSSPHTSLNSGLSGRHKLEPLPLA